MTVEQFIEHVKPFLPDIRQVGVQWTATCPFCKELTFYIYQDAHFHCFSCPMWGDYIPHTEAPFQVTWR